MRQLAAVIALALLLVGCAVVYVLRMQSLKVGEFSFYIPTEYDEKTAKKRWKEYSAQQMTELAQVLQEVEDFSVEGQEPVVMKWVEEKGYKLGDVMNAFRLALVGIGKGPGMFDISAFLGKEETLRRLHRAISELG